MWSFAASFVANESHMYRDLSYKIFYRVIQSIILVL